MVAYVLTDPKDDAPWQGAELLMQVDGEWVRMAEKEFPSAMIKCPHHIVMTFGSVDICSMCGGKRAAVKTCDHGVSLSVPCPKCGNTLPKAPWKERMRQWLSTWG